MSRWWLRCLSVWGLLGGRATVAVADPADGLASWLTWAREAGAESCPDASQFADRVETQLGASPAAAAGRSRRRIAVRVVHHDGGSAPWSGDVTLLARDGTETGSRHIEQGDPSCGPLTDALALVVTLTGAGADQPAPATLSDERARSGARAPSHHRARRP